MPKRKPLTQLLLMAGVLFIPSLGLAQPAPPGELVAEDHPWDKGEKIDLSWTPSPDDAEGVTAYKVYRSLTAKPPSEARMEQAAGGLRGLLKSEEVPIDEVARALPLLIPMLGRQIGELWRATRDLKDTLPDVNDLDDEEPSSKKKD